MKTSCLIAIAWTFVTAFPTGSTAAPVTTGSMALEMVDFDRLCELPNEKYKTLQFTSYDRRSDTPAGPAWFSNSDGFGGAPIPAFEKTLKEPKGNKPGEYLMLDVEGPGVVVRTWTAQIVGDIRVYLDDSDEPIYDGPAEAFLKRPYDTFVEGSSVTTNQLEGTFYQRDAGYCPMPFAKRCRMVWVGNPRGTHFYYVQVRKYESPEVEVTTFAKEDLKTYAKEITKAATILADPDKNHPIVASEEESAVVTLKPGERSKAIEFKGTGALEQLKLKVSANNEVAALRQTVIHITCDDWSVPQVQSPVGDFFAAAPGVNPYVSLPFTVLENGQMVSRYLMPYRKSLRVEFQNMGDQPVEIECNASAKDRDWDPNRTMYFYARWRVMHDLVTSPPVDIPFLVANGAGRYIGTVSLMMNPARGTHPSGSWWGEGDEKVFVDDDQQPSWFGTGSEDYYNYSWSAFDIFYYPYCGQPRNDGPANRGFVTNYRFHFIDDQPFDTRCSFYMELLAHTRVEGFSYACQAYHYGRPGMMDDHRPITAEDVRKPVLPGPWTPLAVRGSGGATYFEPEKLVDGPVESESGDFWSEGKLTVWKPKAEGDTLKITVPVEKAGNYEVSLALAMDHRSGSVSATLDGKPFGFGGGEGVMKLFDKRRTMSNCSTSDKVELTAGEHVIELKFENSAPDAEPFVGIDFIWLQPR